MALQDDVGQDKNLRSMARWRSTARVLVEALPFILQYDQKVVVVKFGGSAEQYVDENKRLRVRWVPHKTVIGVPYDTPILGYRTNTANTLRLWRSEAPESFDFSIFNSGDYYGAVNQKVESENLSKVLYPNDEQARGKEGAHDAQLFRYRIEQGH